MAVLYDEHWTESDPDTIQIETVDIFLVDFHQGTCTYTSCWGTETNRRRNLWRALVLHAD